MFEIGSGELLIIALVALIVLGPERLPKAARFVGLWVRRARNQWNSVRDELERELAADELKRSLHDTQDSLRRAGDELRAHGAEAQREFDAVRDTVEDRPASTTPAPPPQADATPAPASPDKSDESRGA